MSFAGFLIALGYIIKPSAPGPTDYGLFVWAFFSSLCILGATATLFPHLCSNSTHSYEDLDTSRFTIVYGVRLVHGHHPTCGRFKDHEFTLQGKTFCAGCTGLFIGAVTALSVTTLHFSYTYFPHSFSGYIGLGCVVLGLVYALMLKMRMSLLSLAFNALLILGFALILVTVDGLGSLGFDLIVIGLCVFWMLTRIQLSHWSHDVICGGCDELCEKKTS